jgi:hypothetical protein
METVMLNEVRDTLGKFAPKSEIPRKVRSVNLTDDAWQWLAEEAQKAGMSRNDYLEVLAEGNNPLMETVQPESIPLMETVRSEIEADDVNIGQQPNSELLPLMETVRVENQRLHMELGNLQVENETLKKEVQRLLSALELPEAPNLLNQLKAKRKKTTASLADIEAILEILEE